MPAPKPLPVCKEAREIQATFWAWLDSKRGDAEPEAVAVQAGFKRSAWFDYKRGRTSPELDKMCKLAALFGERLTVAVGSLPVGASAPRGSPEMTRDLEAIERTLSALDAEQRRRLMDIVRGFALGAGVDPSRPVAATLRHGGR